MKTLFKKSILTVTLIAVLFCTLGAIKVSAQNSARYSAYGDAVAYSFTTSGTETITYTSRVDSYVETVKSVPKYMQLSELSNSCGPTAGAIVVGFYDKYYENLIPDYVSYVGSGTYKGTDSVYVPQVMRELYTLMRTNVDDVGVSMTDCLNGLSQYVVNHGYSLQYTNVRNSNGSINETSFSNAISNNRPVLLFCSRLDVYNFTVGETSERLVCSTQVGGHVVVAYGYYTVNYYNGSTLFRTEKYVRVATGLNPLNTGYVKLYTTNWCNGAYAVTIS